MLYLYYLKLITYSNINILNSPSYKLSIFALWPEINRHTIKDNRILKYKQYLTLKYIFLYGRCYYNELMWL